MNLILITVIGISTQSCKKGENDPFLSFRSRDGRLTRSWSLSSIDQTTTTTVSSGGPSVTSKTTVTYSGKVKTTQKDKDPADEDQFTLELTFDKRGIVTYRYESFDDDGKSTGVFEGAGSWAWNDTDKRKSGLSLSFEEEAIDNEVGGDWDVDQLKKKELILKHSYQKKMNNKDNSVETSMESTYTFTEN